MQAKAQALKQIRATYPTEFKEIMDNSDEKNYKKKYRRCEKMLKNKHRTEFLEIINEQKAKGG